MTLWRGHVPRAEGGIPGRIPATCPGPALVPQPAGGVFESSAPLSDLSIASGPFRQILASITKTRIPGTAYVRAISTAGAAAFMACRLTCGPPPPRFWGQTTEGTCVGYLPARTTGLPCR